MRISLSETCLSCRDDNYLLPVRNIFAVPPCVAALYFSAGSYFFRATKAHNQYCIPDFRWRIFCNLAPKDKRPFTARSRAAIPPLAPGKRECHWTLHTPAWAA
jgi:hypothetical protein